MAKFALDDGCLKVSGQLDNDASEQLRSWCAELCMRQLESVEVDLSKVDMIVSDCVAALVTLWIDMCAAGRQMKVVVSPEVKRVLDIAGLTEVFAGQKSRTDSG